MELYFVARHLIESEMYLVTEVASKSMHEIPDVFYASKNELVSANIPTNAEMCVFEIKKESKCLAGIGFVFNKYTNILHVNESVRVHLYCGLLRISREEMHEYFFRVKGDVNVLVNIEAGVFWKNSCVNRKSRSLSHSLVEMDDTFLASISEKARVDFKEIIVDMMMYFLREKSLGARKKEYVKFFPVWK